VVELAVLERLCAGNRTEGSNPSPSARRGALRSYDLGVSLLSKRKGSNARVRVRKLTRRSLLRACA
jgi:hypothetical protein